MQSPGRRIRVLFQLVNTVADIYQFVIEGLERVGQALVVVETTHALGEEIQQKLSIEAAYLLLQLIIEIALDPGDNFLFYGWLYFYMSQGFLPN